MFKMEKEKKYVISTVYNAECKLVFIDELDVTKYFNECCSVFGIPTGDIVIEIKTNLGAKIDTRYFAQVIENFLHSGSFYVEINIVVKDSGNSSAILTPSEFKRYLRESNAQNLIDENKTNNRLRKTSQDKLIRLTATLALTKYGNYPSSNEKEILAKQLIYSFPYLKYSDASKPDIYTVYNRVNGGLMGQALKNMRARNKTKSKDTTESGEAIAEEHDVIQSLSQLQLDDDSLKNDFQMLKLALVNKENIADIKNKMKSTMKYRKNLMNIPETDVLECFPYLFTHPELVQFDFSQHFANVDSNGFTDHWLEYSSRLKVVMRNFYLCNSYTEWQDDIDGVILLLAAFPNKPNGRKNVTDPILSFKNAVDKLIVFRKIGSTKEELIEKHNSHPYIIACGESKMKISYFYIEVEKNLIQIPDHFTFIETFDIFYKIHAVLDLDFDISIRQMMQFCGHFFYKMHHSKFMPTNKMYQIFNEISRPIANGQAN